jgi:uncharacterized cupredoxin-like copper-binding protein
MRPTFNKFFAVIVLAMVASLALAACGSSASSNKPVDVTVTLTEFTIDSSLTTFSQGVPYHFIVTNKGTVNHEFRIIPPVSGQVSQDQINTMTLAAIPESQLAPGSTATLDYTFTKAYAEGSLELACHLPGHYEAGMHVPITVK